MKRTKKRQQILDALESVHGCISARALAKKISGIDQATIYRNLDLFVKEGLVKKFLFDGSEAVYESAHTNHHHAVCNDCEKVIHVDVSDKDLVRALDIKDFDIASVELVVRGSCITNK